MSNVNEIDNKASLLSGPVLKQLLIFFIPIAAGTLFQQFYNAVDAFVVSKFIGTDALASVGGSPAIVSNLVIGFFTSMTSGCAVVISHLFGSKRIEEIKDAIKTSYLLCIAIGIVVGTLVIIFSPEILTLLKTTSESYDGALQYQRIYFLGTLFLLVYNMGSGILRSLGNAKFPFLCLFVGCGINIVFDILFVAVFNLGIPGVAWATVLAEGIACIMVTIKLLCEKPEFRLDFFKAKFNVKLLRHMLRIGIPSGVQASMYGISNLIQQIGVNELGTLVVASWAMSGKVDGVFWATTSAFGTAITTFVGQNYGAKKYDRIKEVSKKGLFFLATTTLAISSILLLIGRFVLKILTKDQGVVDTTMLIMYYFVPFYVLWTFIEVYSGVLRGIGDTFFPSLIQAIGICVFRIIWVYTIFKTHHTLFVLAMSYASSWVLTDIFIIIYYSFKSKQIFNNNKQNRIDPSLL